MEINTLTKKEYEQDVINTNLREIFEPDKYIASKETSKFTSIKEHLQEIIESLLNIDSTTVDEQLNEKFLDLDFGAEFNIDATKIGINDAIFFINLLNQENLINYSVKDDNLTLNTSDNKKINATNSLLNMLKTSYDTNKAIRLDFDKDVTVILKLDSKGKVQAHFIPGTPEVESYLKNNIQCLRQSFDDEKINYSYLGYSQSKNENKNENKKNKRGNN